MTRKEYEDRLAKSEEKLQKIEKRIQKWEDNKSDKNFAKHYDWLHDDVGWRIGWDGNQVRYGTFEEFKAMKYSEWQQECDRELKYANRDKEDTIVLINKYKNAIALLQEKDAKPVIQIFKDFFDNWKQEIQKYVEPLVAKYYELSKELTDLYNNRSRFIELGFETKEDYKEAVKTLEEQQSRLKSDSFVGIAIEKGYRWRQDDFNKFLDKYMDDRYFELVDKVTSIVGEIEDVSNLKVGYDGRLNGIVIGSEGKAKIETIVAGGYNDDIIVNVKHGQIRHYRVLVHKIK